MKKIIAHSLSYVWVIVHVLLIMFKTMKNFLQKNPEIILIISWFLLIFTITMNVL